MKRFIWRSSVSGRFVRRLFAMFNPRTTTKEEVDVHDAGA